MHRIGAAAALVLAAAIPLLAQSPLSGKWQGDTDGGATLVLQLTVKDTALTGTLVRNGQSSALSDGKVAKNTFTFKATLNDRSEGFAGELKGDEIHIWLERQGPAKAVVLTRVKTTSPKTAPRQS